MKRKEKEEYEEKKAPHVKGCEPYLTLTQKGKQISIY